MLAAHRNCAIAYVSPYMGKVNKQPLKGKQDQAYNAFWYSISINQ